MGAVTETLVGGGRVGILPWLVGQTVDTGEFEPREFLALVEVHQTVQGEDEHVEGIGLLTTELTDGHTRDDTALDTGDGGELIGLVAVPTPGEGEVTRGEWLQGLEVRVFPTEAFRNVCLVSLVCM